MRTALVTGITGQDGSYLSEFLLDKDYKVVGLQRRSSSNNFSRIKHFLNHPNLIIEEYDLTDPSTTNRIIQKYQPEEFYNLAAQSHVGTSFDQPTTTFEINSVGVINILESIRNFSSHTKFYQASTSEMFGRNYTLKDGKKYQDENTTMLPQSPYGVAKLASYHMVQIYRSSYNIFGCSGILFNHESPRRGENFVTRKITKYLANLIKNKTSEKLYLGNLDSYRDWGHAKDYIEAMYLMLQQKNPSDYIIATGETHSVREFLTKAFEYFNLDYNNYVVIDPKFYRPSEVDYLLGDPSKAKSILGWNNKISFNELINDMIISDLNNA